MKQAIVVLGMHRSGTSALTRVCSLLGASLPADLLPATPDNELGYWESRQLFELNRALLLAAGTTWFDDRPIPDDWHRSAAAAAIRPAALAFIDQLFQSASLVVLKDPRLCRLWPFWRTVFDETGVVPQIVLALRHPDAVFQSLRRRARTPEMHGAAITCAEKSHLLWLRYVLEAERQTRDCRRVAVTFEGLLARPADTVGRLTAGMPFPVAAHAALPAIDAFLSARHDHYRRDETDAASTVASEVYEMFAANAEAAAPLAVARLDAVRRALDAVETAYAPLRAPHRLTSATISVWEPEMVERVADRVAFAGARPLRVVFLSSNPDTRGHWYRVAHHVDALNAAGAMASWRPAGDADAVSGDDADVVVAWRTVWDDRLQRLYERCRARGVPIGFDSDDLVFDPAIMTVDTWDYLRFAEPALRQHWLEHVVPGYARTVAESDFVLASTHPLAANAASRGKRAYVLPNGIDLRMIDQAVTASAESGARPADGRIRLGYASGTPTHQKDFAVVAPIVAGLLAEFPQAILTVVGCLTLDEFPELIVYHDRIEQRPLVPFDARFREYARFDINMAPLQRGNPFCDGKSELKYFEPALVRVPTVAAATPPFVKAIKAGETGFCAATGDEWRSALRSLLADAALRERVGRAARVHALAAFGPDAQAAAARRVFHQIVADAAHAGSGLSR